MTKKEVYSSFGIEYESGKIKAPLFGWVSPLLIDGNAKLGRGVWTFSTLPGTDLYRVNMGTKAAPDYMKIKGTCVCNCQGCYAKTGFYRMASTIKALAIRTALVRGYLDWAKRAIMAQIKADGIKLCRIHAAGDFFSREYVAAWYEIALENPDVCFWTYTKNPDAVNAFDDLPNANIVKSIVPGFGFNYGPCGYILRVYKALRDMGKRVYICRCGVDKNQHCNVCRGCADNEIVLFIEHSTAYKAELDQDFQELAKLIESQKA